MQGKTAGSRHEGRVTKSVPRVKSGVYTRQTHLEPVLFSLITSVEWGLKCVDFYFWQGTMRRNNALLRRIVTQQKLTSGVL
jgi:hypothetical protein